MLNTVCTIQLTDKFGRLVAGHFMLQCSDARSIHGFYDAQENEHETE
jgi:hypothetical protein